MRQRTLFYFGQHSGIADGWRRRRVYARLVPTGRTISAAGWLTVSRDFTGAGGAAEH